MMHANDASLRSTPLNVQSTKRWHALPVLPVRAISPLALRSDRGPILPYISYLAGAQLYVRV